MAWFWIFVGGGIGSLARFGISELSGKWISSSFPWGTFISNFFACLILALVSVGLVVKFPAQNWIYPLIITGFCGGFSTFSTFGNETVNLIQQGNYLIAILNILLSLLFGIGIIFWIRSNS